MLWVYSLSYFNTNDKYNLKYQGRGEVNQTTKLQDSSILQEVVQYEHKVECET